MESRSRWTRRERYRNKTLLLAKLKSTACPFPGAETCWDSLAGCCPYVRTCAGQKHQQTTEKVPTSCKSYGHEGQHSTEQSPAKTCGSIGLTSVHPRILGTRAGPTAASSTAEMVV